MSPIASALDLRWGMYARDPAIHNLGFVVEALFGGWAATDATGTDPLARQVQGDIVVFEPATPR